jgi:membrane-bound lytic murein transglycosylase D
MKLAPALLVGLLLGPTAQARTPQTVDPDWPMVPTTHAATPQPAAATPEAPPADKPSTAAGASTSANPPPLTPAQKFVTISAPPAGDDEPYIDEEELLPTPLPEKLLFTRLRNSFALPDAADSSIQKELDWYGKHPSYVQRVLQRSERYLFHIVSEVEARGLPMELALLPVVESAFNPYAYSPGRAAGLWQFIPASGARMGLKQNWWQDQRRDVVASTSAALDYLQKLNAMFGGDWLLTIAAYNTGEVAVQRAMQKNRQLGLPTTFWALQLPKETRAYVPRLLAIRTLLMDPESRGLRLPPIADAPYFRRVDTGGQFDLRVAAEYAKVTPEELHALNPGYHRWATDPEGPHRLYVPVQVADQFAITVATLNPAQRLSVAAHRVSAGETLASIARQYKTAVEALRAMNPTQPAKPFPGAVLRVPVDPGSPLRSGLVIEGDVATVGSGSPASSSGTAQEGSQQAPRAAKATPRGPRELYYRVQAGDSLYSVARRFAVTVADLKRWNGLKSNKLRPGQKLLVRVRAAA